MYSDTQITAWLNELGYLTAKGRSFNKDSVRDILCNPYFVGKIRYRSMIGRPKGVSFRSIPPQVSGGQHDPLISEELWRRYQAVLASRLATVKTVKKTVQVKLLQGLVVCAQYDRLLRIQTPKRFSTHYREDPHLRGYHDYSYIE